MDFTENLNESYDLRFEEIGELGDPVFIIIDNDNNMQHRFYSEDLQKFVDFLIQIRRNPKNVMSTNINESYNLKYHKDYDLVDDKNVLILEDIDNGNDHNFYDEDIKKIIVFLNQLKEFKVTKTYLYIF